MKVECADCCKDFSIKAKDLEDENFCPECTAKVNAEYEALVAQAKAETVPLPLPEPPAMESGLDQ